MKKILTSIAALIATVLVAAMLAGCVSSGSLGSTPAKTARSSSTPVVATAGESSDSYAESHLVAETYSPPPNLSVSENGEYTDKDSVALYIHQFGHVPSNYVSKTKARNAGWVSSKGNLQDVLPGKSIGGGGFFNDDGMMPDAPGREWFECDIDYTGGFRNSKRIVYSNDGLIYYTDDHYKTFQRLY